MCDWHRHAIRLGGHAKVSQDTRQDQRPFDHGKTRASADPWPGREWDKGVALALLSVFGLPTGWVKTIRIVPKPFMPVQVPRAEHKLRPLSHLSVAKRFGAAVLAHHHRHGWIKPQRLPKHIPAKLEF